MPVVALPRHPRPRRRHRPRPGDALHRLRSWAFDSVFGTAYASPRPAPTDPSPPPAVRSSRSPNRDKRSMIFPARGTGRPRIRADGPPPAPPRSSSATGINATIVRKQSEGPGPDRTARRTSRPAHPRRAGSTFIVKHPPTAPAARLDGYEIRTARSLPLRYRALDHRPGPRRPPSRASDALNHGGRSDVRSLQETRGNT